MLFPHNISFSESEPVTVELNAGKNTIRLETGEGWIWFDYLLVKGEGSVTTTESSKTTESATTTTTTSAGGRNLLGDVDCNDEVELRDAVMLAKMIAGSDDVKDLVTVQARRNADMDRNDSITGEDLRLLLLTLAGALD